MRDPSGKREGHRANNHDNTGKKDEHLPISELKWNGQSLGEKNM